MPEQDNPESLTPLEYRDKREDAANDRGTLVGVALAATAGFGLVLFGSVYLAAVGSYAYSQPLFLILPLVVTAGALVLGLHVLLHKRRAVGAGLLIGIGVAVLIHGACFYAISG